MSNPIILPPLPSLALHADRHYQGEGLADQLRAYGLEVARLMLEAAASACEQYQGSPEGTAEIIRALEVRHG